jgi:hypothetical protein
MDIQLDLSNKPAQEFRIYWKIQDGRRGVKSPKSTKFDPSYPTNHFSAWHLNPVHLIWIKFGMDILLDHKNKSAQEFLINRKIQDGRHSGVKCPKSTKFDPTNHILARRGTLISFIKFGQILALTYYLTFKQVCKEFLIYHKIQEGRWGSKVRNRPILTHQIMFWLGISIWFIRFRQNLA